MDYPFRWLSNPDLEQHQLLCEKLVTEAINSEDRLQGQTGSWLNQKPEVTLLLIGTIESLRNKLSLSTSLSFSEVAAPLPAIQTPDRCYKGIEVTVILSELTYIKWSCLEIQISAKPRLFTDILETSSSITSSGLEIHPDEFHPL